MQTNGCLCHLTPASHVAEDIMCSKAPLLHRRYPASSLLRTSPSPSRLSVHFPVSPVIEPTLLQPFLTGTRTASPVARSALVTVLSLPPRRSDMPHQSACDIPCCLRPHTTGSASGALILTRLPMGSLVLRPGDLLTIPKMALSVSFIRFVSSTNVTQATGR